MEPLLDIPFELDRATLLKLTHVESDSDDAREFDELLEAARAVAKPKAVYRECFIDSKGDDAVTVEGITFTSRTLRKNLDRVERVFAYVATCGHEVAEIDLVKGDMLKEFWLDVIKASLLGFARNHLVERLRRRFLLGDTSSMSPGSGDTDTWPIEQQHKLFALLGDVEGAIGVVLTESSLMIPNKTVSGFQFPAEKEFRTCQVCHRPRCPSRGAAFDAKLWESIQHE